MVSKKGPVGAVFVAIAAVALTAQNPQLGGAVINAAGPVLSPIADLLPWLSQTMRENTLIGKIAGLFFGVTGAVVVLEEVQDLRDE